MNDEDRPSSVQQQPIQQQSVQQQSVQQLQQLTQQQTQYYSSQQSIQSQNIVSSENEIHLPSQPLNLSENIAPILPLYNPNYRIPHQLFSFHQVIQNYDIKQNHDYSKKLITLVKMYINEKKYGESLIENLNYKFIIFMNLYIKAEIPQQTVQIAFSTMLKSITLEYYYFSC